MKTNKTKFYKSRLWKLIIRKHNLLDTILPWFVLLELIVLVAIFLFTWKALTLEVSSWRKHLAPTSRIWLFSIWKRLLMDWGHLSILAMIGNVFIEELILL